MRKLVINFTTIILCFLTVILAGTVFICAATVNNATAQVNSSDGVNLRKAASIDSKIITSFEDDTKLTVKRVVFTSKNNTAKKYKWYYVTANGKSGYIRSDFVNNLKYKTVTAKATAAVKYRSGAGTQMKYIGTIAKGKTVTVKLKATPVSSTQGSSSTWYMIQVGGKVYYASSKYLKIQESKPTDTEQKTEQETGKTENIFENMTDSEFEQYLINQGFTDSYIGALKELHKNHPNWIFKANVTGLDWNDVLTKENKDGVSLISSSMPLSYRSTDSNSYTSGSATVYKEASASSDKKGTVKSGDTFTVLDEKWIGTVQWTHVRLSDGTIGYIKNSLSSMKYPDKYSAIVNDDDVNLRKGAGTDNSVVASANKGEVLTVVLKATDKNNRLWYKIKRSSGYAYIISDYVDLESETADADLDNSTATAGIPGGKYIPKDGSSWFNAKKTVVAYYLDPRNFLNEDRIYMFEYLSYDADSQTQAVVRKVLSGSKLPDNGFTAKVFVNAGKKYDISPVFLASRARQETGGGSSCINGTKYNGKVVYNPFNIGAYSSSNPQQLALKRAYEEGWFTQQDAVNGGAKLLAESYINSKYKQNTIYFQRFNTATGNLSYVATHQYMTNIMAPYSESISVKNSYVACGIDNDALIFIIPVYESMPDSTSLPS